MQLQCRVQYHDMHVGHEDGPQVDVVDDTHQSFNLETFIYTRACERDFWSNAFGAKGVVKTWYLSTAYRICMYCISWYQIQYFTVTIA